MLSYIKVDKWNLKMLAECIKSSSFPLAIAFALFFIKDSYKTFRSP